VRSTFVVEQTDSKTGKPAPFNTVATAEELHYDEAKRVATYTTNARMNGPQGDLRADTIEMYFLEAGRTLERIEAYRNVTVKTDTRNAEGDRLSYFAADERYVISGGLVRVLEIAECRETTGKTLTFHRSTDTILIDGNREIRTLTKSGGTCVAPPK
jgi:lipopolysaccharide export system protein LptA